MKNIPVSCRSGEIGGLPGTWTIRYASSSSLLIALRSYLRSPGARKAAGNRDAVGGSEAGRRLKVEEVLDRERKRELVPDCGPEPAHSL
ncbi:hypothetical protein ACJRO7_016094 [Eucalyptus globulus]|uniref:Uncharacterized protein n=1 Tax=Eucalyptus globulus TaxID=34317 RepID=A0ABD3L6U2_EUCGL